MYTRDSNETPNVLWGWVDADWADDTDTHRSHTGYILMMNGGPISWKSQRQDNVSLSTAKTTRDKQCPARSAAHDQRLHQRQRWVLHDAGRFLKFQDMRTHGRED